MGCYYILAFFALLATVYAQQVPMFCALFINKCLSEIAEKRYGYDSGRESIWSFMSRRTTGCQDVLQPYLTNPPFLAVSNDKAEALLDCLDNLLPE